MTIPPETGRTPAHRLDLRLWLGLPHWVTTSLAATLAIACFTAFVVLRYWPDEEHVDR